MGLFGRSKKLQCGTCNYGKPQASPSKAKERKTFIKEKGNWEGLLQKSSEANLWQARKIFSLGNLANGIIPHGILRHWPSGRSNEISFYAVTKFQVCLAGCVGVHWQKAFHSIKHLEAFVEPLSCSWTVLGDGGIQKWIIIVCVCVCVCVCLMGYKKECNIVCVCICGREGSNSNYSSPVFAGQYIPNCFKWDAPEKTWRPDIYSCFWFNCNLY